ncbi:hypothetical protein AMECASPLE_019058, partial [Ameca splendens]
VDGLLKANVSCDDSDLEARLNSWNLGVSPGACCELLGCSGSQQGQRFRKLRNKSTRPSQYPYFCSAAVSAGGANSKHLKKICQDFFLFGTKKGFCPLFSPEFLNVRNKS